MARSVEGCSTPILPAWKPILCLPARPAGLEANQQDDLLRLLRLAADADDECMRAAVAVGPTSAAPSNCPTTDSATHCDDAPRRMAASSSGTGSLQPFTPPSRQRAHTLPSIESDSLASSMSLGKSPLVMLQGNHHLAALPSSQCAAGAVYHTRLSQTACRPVSLSMPMFCSVVHCRQ